MDFAIDLQMPCLPSWQVDNLKVRQANKWIDSLFEQNAKPGKEAGMTENYNRQEQTPVSIHVQSDPRPATDTQWEQIVLELRDCGNSAIDVLDDLAIARYLSGECSASERDQIEQAICESPDLADCIVLAQRSLGDIESAA
jgi:hypothetical protein